MVHQRSELQKGFLVLCRMPVPRQQQRLRFSADQSATRCIGGDDATSVHATSVHAARSAAIVNCRQRIRVTSHVMGILCLGFLFFFNFLLHARVNEASKRGPHSRAFVSGSAPAPFGSNVARVQRGKCALPIYLFYDLCSTYSVRSTPVRQ